MRKLARVLVVVVAAAVVSTDLSTPTRIAVAAPRPENAPVEDGKRADRVSAGQAARALGRRIEVTDDTTETTQTWANPDGTFTDEVYAAPVRSREGEQWVPISTVLERVNNDLGPRAVVGDVTISNGGHGPLATVAEDDVSVSLGWHGTLPAPVVAGSKATYVEALPGVDVEVSAMAAGFEQSFIVKSRGAAQAAFRLPLLTQGVAPVTRHGAVTFVDSAGTERAWVGAARMWDATGRGAPVQVAVVPTPSGRAMEMRPDAAFMADPSLVFPVTIDPTIQLRRWIDTYADSGNPTTAQGSATILKIGKRATGTYRTYIAFDVQKYKDADILDVYQYMGNVDSVSCNATTTTIYKVTGSWTSTGLTWNQQPAVDTTSAGVLATATSANGGPVGSTCQADNWMTFHDARLTTAFNAWADGGNYGMSIRTSETDLLAAKDFASGELNAWQPRINVTYNYAPRVPAARYVDPANTTSDGTRYARSTTPTLGAGSCDADGDPVRIDYEVKNSSGAVVQTSPTTRDMVASCAYGVWAMTTPLAEGTYTWRTRAWDGKTYSAWSSAITMIVDVTAPSAPAVSLPGITLDAWNTGGFETYPTITSTSTDVVGYETGFNDPTTPTFDASNAPFAAFEGEHTYYARSVDQAGNKSATTAVWFGVGNVGLTSPAKGARTEKTFTLDAKARPTWTHGTWQWRRAATDAWQAITDSRLKYSDGSAVTQPLAVTNGELPDVRFDAEEVGADGSFELSLVLSAPEASPVPAPATSLPRQVSLDRTDFASVTATEQVGPGAVNLLTGNLQVTASDVAVTGLSDLTVARTFNSRAADASPNGPFGPGWSTALPVLDASSVYTGLAASGSLVTVTLAGGDTVSFTKSGNVSFVPEYGAEDLTLTYVSASDRYDLKDLDDNVTAFTKPTNATSYVPTAVTQGGAQASTTYSYETVLIGLESVTRVTGIMAPPAPDVTGCTLATPAGAGCRSLKLTYSGGSVAPPVAPAVGAYPHRLQKVELVAWDPELAISRTVSLAEYAYDSAGRLREAWDANLPTLKTLYTYNGAGQLETVTPPGEAPWTLAYGDRAGESSAGRLRSVSRAAPTPTAQTATTTIQYGVPLSGADAPWQLTPAELDRTGQVDRPVTATAVFPPTTQATFGAATASPSSWDRAVVHYLNADGREVNSADPSGALSTQEHDVRGAVVRTLTAANRQRALDAGATTAAEAAVAATLSTRNVYSDDGLRLLETFGPEHTVTLSNGQVTRARRHTTRAYDESSPSGITYNLETSVTTGARVAGELTDRASETRVAQTQYGATTASWERGQPTARVVDAGGANLTTRMTYSTDGKLLTSTLPGGGTSTATAATRVTRYYTKGTHPDDAACGNRAEWADLVCSVGPGGQPPSGPSVPTQYTTYDMFLRPRVVTEKVGTTTLRTTTTTYDPAGRPWKQSITASTGAALPMVETYYDADGRAAETRQLDASGATTAYVKRTYNALGMVTAYRDADGVESSVTYDVAGRPVQTYDGRGTQTWTYDGATERRGLPTALVDSHAGTFTATYDVAGTPTVDWENGLRVSTTVDETGSPTELTYAKTSCAADCVWVSSRVARSIHGQWRSHGSKVSDQAYSYDGAGRLSQVQDTYAGSCTTRKYAFDGGVAGNSNRTKLETFGADAGGNCQTSTVASSVSPTYDAFDRITTAGTVYDALGRTTTVPDADALDSGNLTVAYHVNDLVRSITRAGLSKTYTLDVDQQRIRSWTEGGVTHTNHYDGDGDAPSWTQESPDPSGTWTRNIGGIAGDLVGIYDSATNATSMQLTNLHGDVVATASTSSTAASPTAQFEADEFGVPRGATGRRYGWLGGKQRAADTPGGLSLMGVRLYNPATGRFLQVDPVSGGSANAYDYAMQDPINVFDLDGRVAMDNYGCAAGGSCDSAMDAYYVKHPPHDYSKPAPKPKRKKKCGLNPVCRAKKHWRGIAQVAIYAVGGAAVAYCSAMTAGLCAGASGVIMTGLTGGATAAGVYAVGGGKKTRAGYLTQFGIGFGIGSFGRLMQNRFTGGPKPPRYLSDAFRYVGRHRAAVFR